MDIISWMRPHASLFRYAGEALSLKKDIKDILLVGPFGACLSAFFRNCAPGAELCCYSENEEDRGIAGMMGADIADKLVSGKYYDYIAAPLYIQGLDTRELTGFLFDVNDALKEGGVFYLSFPDALAPTVAKKQRVKSFYSDGEIWMKYFMTDDVIRALEMVGFSVKAIESDPADFHDRVITLLCVKGK